MFVVLVQTQLLQVLQEELEDRTLRTDMRFSFAWTQISSHLPSLITSVRTPYSPLDVRFLHYSS